MNKMKLNQINHKLYYQNVKIIKNIWMKNLITFQISLQIGICRKKKRTLNQEGHRKVFIIKV